MSCASSAPASAPPRVSVLLPARNAAATLDEALAGLRAQTLTDWECLIVDDGSTDETPAIARAWAAGDGRIRLLPSPARRGIVAALRAAAARARAAVFARQDADDISRPRRLAASLALLESDASLGAVACRVRLFPGDALGEGLRVYGDWLNEAVTPEQIAGEIWVESPLPHPAVVMRREAYTGCGGYRHGPWPEDYDLWLRLHRAGWRFAKVPEVLYDWRHRPGRLTFSDPRYAPEAFLRCKLEHLEPRLRGRALVVWGAGRDGRRLARALAARGVETAAFIDIDPRKVGRERLGRPVHPPEALGDSGCLGRGALPEALVLVAVGSRGARALIRERLAGLGRGEPADFLCLH